MSARRAEHLLAAALCAFMLATSVAASDGVLIQDLKLRAAAGDRAATRQLAEAYYLGRDGLPQDFKEAANWYLKLARQGDARAQTSMGLMYARGYGVQKDPAQAVRWWSFAAAQNDPAAQFNLGLAHTTGDGVAQDFARAAEWYRRAASRGHVAAQHNLGMLYHEGRGTPRDPLRAYYWLAIAAKQGDDVAQSAIRDVASGMSPEDMQRADRQVAEWFQKAGKVWQYEKK